MLKEYRQELHQIPELELDLPQTQTYIKQHLQSLRCELFEPIPSSVVAYFDFGKKDTFAFRSDMDALPVQEQNDVVASWSDATIGKCKQVLKKTLVENGYLDNSRSEVLNPVLLDFRVKEAIEDSNNKEALIAFGCM